MEFRDRPSLAMLLPPPQAPGWLQSHGVPCSSYSFQFLLLTFHLPLLGGMGEGCPFRGSPGPHMVAPRHTQHKQRASLCPPAAFTANAVLTLSALSPTRPTSSLGQGLLGAGAQLGTQKVSLGGGKGDAQLPHIGAPWGGAQRKGEGCLVVLFYLLFPDFFVSKLADLYYTRIANKGRI